MDFKINALPIESFQHLFAMQDDELANLGARWMPVDKSPSYPCRVSLDDAEVGERVLALTYVHHDVQGPYRSSGPIFIREMAQTVAPKVNEIPEMLYRRPQSVRAYDRHNLMINATVAGRETLKDTIVEFLSDPNVEYIHIHNAKPGCLIVK